MEPITKVVFRKWPKREGGDVVALMFEEVGDYDPATFTCYQHVGQHGCADMGVVYKTKLAKPAEYENLKRELESRPYGYRFKVYKRIPRDAISVRRAALSRIKAAVL
jgi:hypothetical protein